MPDLKIFISSPGDVPDERLRADLIVDKLSQDYSRFFTLSTYRWEHEPMLASGHFQDAIEPPSATDMLILIVWSRLGTPLPEKTAVREYRGIDGRAPVTGTEWEYEDALAAARAHGTPGILAFRNTRPAPIDTVDPEARAKSLAQLDALDAFWRRHFADKGVFIRAFEGYQTLEQFAQLLEQKLRKLLEHRIATMATTAPSTVAQVWTGSPFRGLQAYEFEHAAIFFGRDEMVASAARHLAMAARHDNAFLLVAGASGSGKSSLVKAAVVPRLMKPQRIEGLAFLRRIIFRPSDAQGDLILGLVEALVQDGRRDNVGLPELLGPGQSAADLAAHLRTVAETPKFVFAAALGRVTEEARKTGRILVHEDARAILVVDQLEELFTRDSIPVEDRTIFVQILAGLASCGLVWVIATMRSDFWHRTADIPILLALAAGERRLDVAAPSPLEFADMIRKPVEAAGLSFEMDRESGIGLDADIAKRAAAEPGVLPLLSFTLDALFAEDVVKNGGRMLTFATYNALGKLEGAIATRAEDIVGHLSESAQRAVPRVLRALTTVSDGVDAIAVARAAPLDFFPSGSDARQVVDALVLGRLLVASGEGGQATVRVAHEALIGRWKRAEDQVALDRRDLETRKLVERQCERWTKADGIGKANLLLRDPDLTNAVDLETRWGNDVQPNHRAFIQRSQAEARATVRRRWVVAGTVMLLLVALTLFSIAGLAIAEIQRNNALIAQSRALARDAASANARGDTTLAMLLALEALPKSIDHPDRPFVLDAEYPLANAFANRRERFVLPHKGNVNAIAFSPDGSRLATASDDGTAIVWDIVTGHPEVTFVGDGGHIASVEFSHDGRRLLTASDGDTAWVWDAATGKRISVLNGHAGQVASASFSSDGAFVVAAFADGTATIFDAVSGKATATLRDPTSNAVTAVFSPNGAEVATASDDGSPRLWTKDGTLLARLPSPTAGGTVVSFSPDGHRLVSAADDGTARVWDTSTYALVSTLNGHVGRINSAVFSPDGREVLTGSDDHTARLWDTTTGAIVRAFLGHDGIVYSAAFSADGNRVITASDDRTARVWDARNGFLSAVLGGHNGSVIAALFSPDGHSLATASHEPFARLWNVDSSATRRVLRGGTMPVQAAFSPDRSRIATGSDDGVLRLWDLSTGTLQAEWGKGSGPIRSVAFSPDGASVLTASKDGAARLWSVATGSITALEHDGPVNIAAFSPDGQRIVTASDDKSARIWSARNGELVMTFQHDAPVTEAAFSPDGSRLVTASDTHARLWNARSGAPIAPLEGHRGAIKALAFSVDGERIATGAGDGARLWDGKTGALISVLVSNGSTIASVAFAPDGSTVATASGDHDAHLWDARTGHPIRDFVGHSVPLEAVAFSPDGRRLVTASDDRTARYWDVATGQTIAVLAGHEAGVTSAAFSKDGTEILTAATDATARVWSPPPLCQLLSDQARQAVPRDLTDEERGRFFLTREAADWSTRLQALSAPLVALFVPTAGNSCR